MKKKIIVVFLLFCCFILFIINNPLLLIIDETTRNKNNNNIKTDQFLSVIQIENNKETKKISYKKTERFFKNGKIIFYEIKNKSIFKKKVIIKTNKKSNQNIKTFNLGSLTKKTGFSATTGYDKLKLPSLYLEKRNTSQLISPKFYYSEKAQKYNKKDFSKVRVLNKIEEINNENEIYNIIIPGKTNVNFYIINCNKKCLNNKQEIILFANKMNTREITPWLTADGNYYKIPYSIEPYSPDAYARNLGSNAEKKILNYYNDNNVIYKILTDNSVFNFLNILPKNKHNVWLTDYTSTWLKKPYGLTAPFVDTRFNEMIGYYLSSYGNITNNKLISKMDKYYGDYLLNQYKNNYTINLKNGMLFPDYFSNNNELKTHASINHQLAIINYLLNLKIKYNDKNYEQLALNILKTIEKNSDDWIKPNGDLWYRIDKKGNYGESDYTLVTFLDLIYTQELLQKISKPQSAEINKLIKSKYSYLKSINYNFSKSDLERYRRVINN